MIKANKDMRLVAGAIVLSNGVPGLMNAWRLSQALIMTTHFSHEIDASRLRLTAKVRFGNPTGNSLKISYPVITCLYQQKILYTSSDTNQNYNLNQNDELYFVPITIQISRQAIPGYYIRYEKKEKVNVTAEIKSVINGRTPIFRTMIIRI